MSINTAIQPVLQRIFPTQNLQVQHFTPFRNILLGGGICYAIEQNKIWHVPIAFLFPSIYVGYQGYKNRLFIQDFTKKTL